MAIGVASRIRDLQQCIIQKIDAFQGTPVILWKANKTKEELLHFKLDVDKILQPSAYIRDVFDGYSPNEDWVNIIIKRKLTFYTYFMIFVTMNLPYLLTVLSC